MCAHIFAFLHFMFVCVFSSLVTAHSSKRYWLLNNETKCRILPSSLATPLSGQKSGNSLSLMSYNLSLDLYLKNIFVLFLEPCYFRDALWSQLYSFVAYILAVMWDKVCQNWCYNTVPRRLHLVLFKHNGLVLCFSCTIFFFFITVFSGLTSPSHRVSFSDVTSARVSGCAAMWIFKRFAITQCLG